ncbi:MAG TPA: septal ring lytic transglycosylase RlpA family protein [Bradyrhizobium sp.]|jgi:rare lipoprotein A
MIKKVAVAAVLFCAAVFVARALIVPAAPETGQASFYGGYFHGRKMANGERFDRLSDSCAHRKHPFGTRLRVTLAAPVVERRPRHQPQGEGRSVTCVVRDRGPFVPGRIVDLSLAGARALGIEKAGVAEVSVSVMR